MQYVRNIVFTVLLLLCVSALFASPDYSLQENWAYYCEGDGKPVDLFLVCPTVDMGEEGNENMSLEDEGTKASFIGALNMERGIYEDVCVMYAPFYRQMTFPLYAERRAEDGEALTIAYGDIEEAFLFFLERTDEERPFILAGFSQGAQLVLMLMEEHFDDTELQDRLVAAYCIGWKITDDDLNAYPHLKLAERADDTGVIVSFNTESPDTEDSIIVPADTYTYGINPLNWRCDSEIAQRELNIGACFTDYSGAIIKEEQFLTGAYLDEERGTLKAIDINAEDYSSSLFPAGVYHLYDYQFFFRNLEENVRVRFGAWLEDHGILVD